MDLMMQWRLTISIQQINGRVCKDTSILEFMTLATPLAERLHIATNASTHKYTQ